MKLLTIAMMVDNLVEKIDECLLIGAIEYCLRTIRDHKNCPLYGVVGCPLFRGCLSIEMNGRTVGTFRIVPLYHGCPLFRGVR